MLSYPGWYLIPNQNKKINKFNFYKKKKKKKEEEEEEEDMN